MAKFYTSDNGKYETPKDEGFYISYKTESGDTDYLGPYSEDMDRGEATEILKRDAPWEWENGKFYAWVLHVDYNKKGVI